MEVAVSSPDFAVPAFGIAVRLAVEAGLDAAAIIDGKGKALAVAGALDPDEARARAARRRDRCHRPEARVELNRASSTDHVATSGSEVCSAKAEFDRPGATEAPSLNAAQMQAIVSSCLPARTDAESGHVSCIGHGWRQARGPRRRRGWIATCSW
ncbi:MAG: hypothetical protein HOV81_07315 [Kofleriaceae bacterium]|nr:hypothetical protein [Kofleriaceae bacterium]